MTADKPHSPRIDLRNLLSAACAAACAALMPATAGAQDEGPAIDTSGGGVRSAPPAAPPADVPSEDAGPAVDTTPRGPREGTTIFGEDENPIGLYIIPWRASSPSPELDRPARFVDETERPIDRTQFLRFVEYYEALTRHRQAQMEAAGSDSGP